MPQAVGRNAVIWWDDSSGTCRNMSGDHNNAVLTWTRDNVESSTFTKDTKQRLPSLRDATFTGATVWDTGSALIDNTAASIMSASMFTRIQFAPGGSISGCPLYTACMLISNIAITAPLNGPVALAYTMQIASGSVTVGTSG